LSGGELGLGELLDGLDAVLFQPGRDWLGQRGIGNLGECPTPPQAQRRAQGGDSAGDPTSG